MITLHALEQSRSFRIAWLLELLELDYELRQHARDRQSLLAPAALREVHPLGKAPVLQDGDMMLAESGAIVDYLISTYGGGRFMPARGSAEYWPYQRWLHYAEASLMPLLLVSLIFTRVENAPVPFFIRPVARSISGKVRQQFTAPQLARHLEHIDHTLNGQTWLMGDNISGADIMLSYPLQAAARRTDLDAYANIRRYLAQIEKDPAYQRTVAKVGTPILDH